MLKNKIWLGIILSIILLVFSVNGFTAYYKYTQESGANFYVGTGDKADALEDTNEMRQIIDDLGALLAHSKRDDLYPKNGLFGGTIQIPEAGLKFSNDPVNNDIAAYIAGEMAWQTKEELGLDLSLYYLKTEMDDESKLEGILADVTDILTNNDLTNIVYCNDYANPDEAITAIGASNKTLLVTEVETCDTNFTVPINVTVRFERGGKWTINNGITVTFNGSIQAGLWQIFEYTGTGTLAGTPKIREVYPQWWGALADGSNDDDVAIQDAIDFTRDTVIFPEGIYLISAQLTLKSNLTLEGISLKSIIKLKDSTIIRVLYADSKTNITIKNLSFDGNKANQTAVEANLRGGIRFNSSVTDSAITECKLIDFNGNAIELYSSSNNIRIEDNLISNNGTDLITSIGDGIYINDSDYVIVEGNHINTNERWGIGITSPTDPSTYINITNNTIIVDNTNALGGIDLEDGDHCNINDNVISTSLTCKLINIYGSWNNIANNNLYGSIGIEIWENENIAIGNTLYNSNISIGSNTEKVSIIDNNLVQGNITIGEGDKEITIIGNVLRGCTRHSGIRITTSVEDIQIIGNFVRGCTYEGIKLSSAVTGVVSGNIIKDAGRYGLYIVSSTDIIVSENIIRDSVDNDFVMGGTNNNILIENNIPMYYTAAPTAGTWARGTKIWHKSPLSGQAPGWICVSRVDTQIRVQANETDTTMEVDSTSGMLAADIIGITLDNDSIHWTTIASITDGDTLEITAGIPAGRDAPVDADVYTNRWKGMANLN